MPEQAELLREGLRGVGFDEVRYAALGTAAAADALDAWLKAGYQADMAWMERTAGKRRDPNLVLPGARSVVMLGVSTWRRDAGMGGGPAWARYARYSDYHDTIKAGLVEAGKLIERIYGVSSCDYRYSTDTAPVGERRWAERAGLGFTGRNAMLISRSHGNWLLLASILVRIELPPDPPLRPGVAEPAGRSRVGLLCGTCTRCLDACPTAAFPEPGVVDARRCISYQTIENRGVIPRELRAAIGPRVFGCDTCLEVCPWNRFARAGRQLLLEARDEIAALSWRDLLRMTSERFVATFRKTPIKRLKLAGLLRNACVGAGNSGDRSLLPDAAALAVHENPLVRAHAVWAVRRLAAPAEAAERLARARAAESDPCVREEYEAR
ncbi:MAG: tRNA epoxyqueuosine(34) reductase QueG [Opitutaceae bacterium]